MPAARDLFVSETRPRRLNVLADSMSRRLQITGTEWFLYPVPDSVPDLLHLVHSGTGSVLQLATIVSCPHLSLVSRSQGSSSGCSVLSEGQAMSLCLSTSCSYVASASQVYLLGSVPYASSGSAPALIAVAANASHLTGGFSSRDTPVTTTVETAKIRSVSQASRAGSPVHMEPIVLARPTVV